jgi:hypothetical protein
VSIQPPPNHATPLTDESFRASSQWWEWFRLLTLTASPASIAAASFLTIVNETAVFPNSRMLLPGSGISFDDTVPGERTIDAVAIPGESKRTIAMTFDGGGSPPTVGSIGYFVSQFAGVIDRWDIVADVSGSAVVDVWKLAGAIPTNVDSIAGTEKPTLTAQQLASDAALTTWATPVAVGDVFGFEIESVTTCTRLTVGVRILETV